MKIPPIRQRPVSQDVCFRADCHQPAVIRVTAGRSEKSYCRDHFLSVACIAPGSAVTWA